MPQTINTNILSLTAQRNLNSSQGTLATAMQRLSSGLRVNSAKDDAAGLAIAERMNTQIRGMNVAIRNANDGISLAQSAEGGLQEVSSMLQRMRELAVQSRNGTNDDADRANLNAEFVELDTEIGRIAATTKFNKTTLLNGGGPVSFQVGANTTGDDTLSITLTTIAPLTSTIDTAAAAQTAITDIDTMIDEVTTARASFGAMQSRFESAINNLQIGVENQSAVRGRIVDADFAVETANMTRSQILQQAGNAMVAQANSAPQSVLQLLG